MEAGPRNSDSKQAAQENRQRPDSEGRRKKKRKRYEWTVTEVADTRIKMKRIRVSRFQSRDLEVFYQFLNDPVIEQFLKSDDLLTVMIKYFSLLEFLTESDGIIDVFLALSTAYELDTIDMSLKWLLLPSIFGSNWSRGDFREYWPFHSNFFSIIDWGAWVMQKIREEIGDESSDEGNETPAA